MLFMMNSNCVEGVTILRISERISSSDKDLDSIRHLKKLSATSVFDQTLFETTGFKDLAHLTVKLTTQVINVGSIFSLDLRCRAKITRRVIWALGNCILSEHLLCLRTALLRCPYD